MSETKLQKRPLLMPAAIAALMLFGALGDWPYGYYQLLRFVVCGVGGYTAFVAYEWQKLWATWLFALIAVLFNPLIPIHLPREVWQLIDVTCIFLFIAVAVILRKPIVFRKIISDGLTKENDDDVSRLFRENDNLGADSSLWLRVIRQLLNDGKPPGKPVIVTFETRKRDNLPFGAFMLTNNNRLIFWPALPPNAEQVHDHVTLELQSGKTHITEYDSEGKAIHPRGDWRRLDYSQDESLPLWFLLSLRFDVLLDQDRAVQRKVPTPSSDKQRREAKFINLCKEMRLEPIAMPAIDADPYWIYCAIFLVTGELRDINLDPRIFTSCLETLVKECPPNEIPPIIASKVSVGNREVVIAVSCPSGIPTSSVDIGFPNGN